MLECPLNCNEGNERKQTRIAPVIYTRLRRKKFIKLNIAYKTVSRSKI